MTNPTPISPNLQLPDIGRLMREAEAARVAGRFGEAEMLSQKVLAVWPGQPEAIHLLGLLAHGHGNLDLAIDYLRQACRSPSAPANFYSNLAEMYRQRGKLPEGEAAARRAVAINPGASAGWNNLGIILQEAGQLEESKNSLERVLKLQPDSAEAHNNLANTCKRLGLIEDAEKHWTRALELRPQYPEALSNMVILLTEQGNYPLAEEYGLRALRLNPRLTDAYVNLAALASACNNYPAALELLDKLLRLAPDHAEGLAARAATLRQLDRLDEALASAQRAVALAPNLAEPQHSLGIVLQALGRSDAAMAAYQRSAELAGDSSDKAMVSQGRLLTENGKTAEARKTFEAALNAFPNSAAAWSSYADLNKFKPGDAEIAEMEALLAAGAASRAQRMLLHFSLGKAYLDTGDSDRAFSHLDAGNRMKRATINYDGPGNRKWMASIGETFNAALVQRLGGGGASSPLPIFVLGMPRSGTTLVEQILASHADIQGAGELKFLHRIATSAGDYPRVVQSLDRGQLTAMGRAYLSSVEPLAHGRRHVVDKMPSNFLYAGFIRLILPEARIVHCRRDPVDTCLSCYSKIFADEQSFTYDQGELGAFHRAYQDLMGHWRTVLPASHFIEVNYEDVVEDIEGEARRLLAFLGLPWDPACLEFYRTERPVRTASVNQVRQPVYRTSSGRWRSHANHLGPLLSALGVVPT
ncbi:MAG TPA: sulfotransferase [Devosiaceae bacterium]|nr:sulfotransferase [Devosiaceae bacterium]